MQGEAKKVFPADRFIFRSIRPEEAAEAAEIEQICFPPNEACTPERIRERVGKVPDLFLVAEDTETGKLAGFLNGVSTDETVFRDDFFTDISICDPNGRNVMLLGLDVLPAYRGRGLATRIMENYIERERRNGRTCLYLTCLEGKVKMYEKMGYRDHGMANSSWGGEAWHEMSFRL